MIINQMIRQEVTVNGDGPGNSAFSDRFPVRIDGMSISELTAYFTPTCMRYCGGYWWIGGNDASGNGYFAYSADLTSWVAQCIRTGRNHPVRDLGVTGDTENLVILSAEDGYGGRNILIVADPLNFASGDSYGYFTKPEYNFTSAVSHDGSMWILDGTTSTWYFLATAASSLAGPIAHGSLSHGMAYCCMYGTYPIAISKDGYCTFKSSITSVVVGGETLIGAGLTCSTVDQMGDYLCVLATKADGTYLYYAKGTPGALEWSSRRISASVTAPIGMGYSNGLYVVAYMDDGKLRFWAAEDIAGDAIGDIHLADLDGYTGAVMRSHGGVLAALLDTGAKTAVARYTCPAE